MIKTSALERAISYLDAVEVAPGRYAYRMKFKGEPEDALPYRIVTETQMSALGAAATDMTSNWFPYLGEPKVEMPSWWTPERRFAVRDINTGEIVPDAVLRGSPLAYQGITADLDTGAQIVADLTNVPRSEIYGAR